jgi:hypothetical protein
MVEVALALAGLPSPMPQREALIPSPPRPPAASSASSHPPVTAAAPAVASMAATAAAPAVAPSASADRLAVASVVRPCDGWRVVDDDDYR